MLLAVKSTISLLATAALLALSGVSCERPGPEAHGSGYGVGIPRVAFTLTGEPRFKGGSKLGFRDPAHPPEPQPWSHTLSAAGARDCDHLAIDGRLRAKTP
jgi:hypothetical protein